MVEPDSKEVVFTESVQDLKHLSDGLLVVALPQQLDNQLKKLVVFEVSKVVCLRKDFSQDLKERIVKVRVDENWIDCTLKGRKNELNST